MVTRGIENRRIYPSLHRIGTVFKCSLTLVPLCLVVCGDTFPSPLVVLKFSIFMINLHFPHPILHCPIALTFTKFLQFEMIVVAFLTDILKVVYGCFTRYKRNHESFLLRVVMVSVLYFLMIIIQEIYCLCLRVFVTVLLIVLAFPTVSL